MLAGCAALLALAQLSMPSLAQPRPVKGEVSASVAGGYARIVFDLAEEVDAQARISNGILIIAFNAPVAVNVDRLSVAAPGYVAIARADPDGRSVRLALARKVTVHAMAAGEKLFVDLLPENWSGMKPGLPQDVVEALARRVREAERGAREQKALRRAQAAAPIRVRVARQPTFTRYVFDLPGLIPVESDRTEERLELIFAAALKFDLADAVATLPAGVKGMESETGEDITRIRFALDETVEARTFRDGESYVVDLTPPEPKKAGAYAGPGALKALVDEAAPAQNTAKAMGAESPPVSGPAAPPAQAPDSPKPDSPAAEKSPVRPPAGPAATAAPLSEAAEQAVPAAANPTATFSPAAGLTGKAAAVTVRQDGDAMHLALHFPSEIPAALFQRGDALWMVFDTPSPLDIEQLKAPGLGIREAALVPADGPQVVRLKLDRPRLVDAVQAGPRWTVTLGPERQGALRSLTVSRAMAGSPRAAVSIDMEGPATLHRLRDPEAGDALVVATALGPARGVTAAQDFLEFRALPSVHGVALQPLADDLDIALAQNRVVIGRPGGLTLSAAAASPRREGYYRASILDGGTWASDRDAAFDQRRDELIAATAQAPAEGRAAARLDLARFYLARAMAAEAKGVLDVMLAARGAEAASGILLRGIASILMERPQDGLRDLSDPLVAHQPEAGLWRSVALSALGKWNEARDGFRGSAVALGLMPPELQAAVLLAMAQAAIEVGDAGEATAQLHELEAVGVPPRLLPRAALLAARRDEMTGRTAEALAGYRAAAALPERPVAAAARLGLVRLGQTLNEIGRDEALAELETLAMVWRGDETEVAALGLLSRLYTEQARYRDAFQAMRVALATRPHSEFTRRMQDDAAAAFDTLFLAGKADALPPIEALSLFYDFRELTPVGRRGDEMIRRLADRLVSVDLLDQAAELLQHQVDHRLQGAARAQVATRLAVIYLMNRRIDRGLQVLRTTRMSGLGNDLRNERLLIEARLLSDSGRHDLALELIENISGPAATRLRGDIHWAAKRWREAAEQIEIGLGDAWRSFAPLDEIQRADVVRAAMAYALAADALGLGRFRERYGGRIEAGPDRRAFEIATSPAGAGSAEFREVARMVAAVGTLEAFLRDLRRDYPNTRALPADGELPRIETKPARPPRQAATASRLAAR